MPRRFSRLEAFAANGMLADAIVREQTRIRNQPQRIAEASVEIILALQGNAIPHRKGLASDRSDKLALARDVSVREDLVVRITKHVTKELKGRGGWDHTGPEAMVRHFRNVAKLKKDVSMMVAEVDNRIITYKLLNTHAHEMREYPSERHNRQTDFFADYHDRSRDPCPMMPRVMQPARPQYVESTGELRRLTREGPRKPVPADEDEVLLAEQVEDRPPMKALKKDKLQYGMTFEIGKSHMSWGIAKPKLGARRRAQLDFKETKDDEIGARVESMGSRSSSLPSLTSPSGNRSTRNGKSVGESIMDAMFLPPIVDASRQIYCRGCDNDGIIPTLLPFVCGQGKRIEAAGRGLGDHDIQTICRMMGELEGLEHVDLEGNRLLTDRSLVPFVQRLKRDGYVQTLKAFGLSGCTGVNVATLDETLGLVTLAENLLQLNLANVRLGIKFQLPFFRTIGKHPTMREVNLSSTGLCNSKVLLSCFPAILASRTLQSLELGWNSFDAEAFEVIGNGLEGNRCLKTLNVSHCSSSTMDVTTQSEAPISVFLERLAHNTALTKLDVSENFVDYRAALVIEDSLQKHRKLTRLALQENPLGVAGVRCMIRLLSRDSSGLMELELEGCYEGGGARPDEPFFSPTNPGGAYDLCLARPYHRTVLRMLYKTCEQFSIHPQQAFLSVAAKPSPYEHPSKDSSELYPVVDEGTLKFVFNIEGAIENALKNVADSDFPGFFAQYFEVTRLRPSFRKVIPLFFNWYRLRGNLPGQSCYVNALSKDFNLTLAHLKYMCHVGGGFANETIVRLMPCLPMDQTSRYIACMMFPRLADLVAKQGKMLALMDFSPTNPTGHYRLDLGNSIEFAVAEMTVLLDRWECAVDRRHERYDISQRGNRSHFRNETYQSRSLSMQCNSIADWSMPEVDIFEFDYVSSARPPKDGVVLSPKTYETILANLHESVCSHDDQIKTVRSVSHFFYITCMQMRQMLGNFPTEQQRAEALLIFFLRIVDIHNMKLFTVRFEKQEEVEALRQRLGHATFFPFMQPEHCSFSLNFQHNDQRICASLVVKMSLKEKAGNIRNYSYIHADGRADPMTLGVPRSWENDRNLPSDGVFFCEYVCAPEDRKFEVRRSQAQLLSFFDISVIEEDVMWWTGLNEAPTDVLDFLEFLICKGFKDHREAFKAIDQDAGPSDAESVITLREFEVGVQALECNKFKGKTEAEKLERIHNVFRYLDPGQEGSISTGEWDVIGQLWAEFELSVREFVEFLVRSLRTKDLVTAWNFIDDDGSGELNETEWLKAVQDCGYFGPTTTVFGMLDTTDDDSVSLDEFMVLEKYIPKDE